MKRQKRVSISRYINIYIKERQTDRQGGQACWRESGGGGADTLAPLPWVTLLLSFCALVSLRPLSSSSSSSSSHLLTLGPYSGHTPPPPSPLSVFFFFPSGGPESFDFNPKTLPQAKGGRVKRRPQNTEMTKKKTSPLGLYWSRCCTTPCPGTPHPLDAHPSASAASVMEK